MSSAITASIYALNAATGRLRWTGAAGNVSVESSPAVAGGVVYVVNDNGNVYALDAATGSSAGPTQLGVRSSPVLQWLAGSSMSSAITARSMH